MDFLRRIPKIMVLILAFLLPLKFGSTVGVPEMPMTYWREPVAILIASWPVMLFPLFASVALAMCLLLLKPENPVLPMRGYGLLWILVTVFSLSGRIGAQTWDFAAQNTAYMLGLGCWVLAVIRAMEDDEKFAQHLFIVLSVSLIFSVYSAMNQYFSGFDETIQYIQDKEAKNGVPILEGQFGNRLREARVSADFAVCNAYAGYLIMLFPLLLGALWKIGSRVTPPLPAKLILTVPTLGLFLFLLKETGSRGGILAMAGGFFFSLTCLPFARKYKILLWSVVPLGIAAVFPMIRLGRGFNSMWIRFDYYQAAFRLMLKHPFTGCGWGEFMPNYLILKNVVNDEAPHSPHNLLLTIGSQCGIISFILAAAILAVGVGTVLYFLWKRSRTGTKETFAPDFCLAWGMTAWTIHSMLDLTFETPGTFALAAALAVFALHQPEIRKIQKPFLSSKRVSAVWLVLNALLCCAALWYPFEPVLAEFHYDDLFNHSNPKYAGANQSQLQPDDLQTLLKACDPRSPFPYAEASDYYLRKGPYYFAEAAALLDKAIEHTPNRAAYYFRKSRILQYVPGRRNEAEAALQKARTLSPKNPGYYPDGVTPFGKRSY